jgi:NAD-dependent SIR2 family protein deacetylase
MKRKNSPADGTQSAKRTKSAIAFPPRCCAAAGCTTSVHTAPHQVPLCATCNERLIQLSVAPTSLHWFTCHIDTSFIRWSSHPNILPPTPLPLGASVALSSDYTEATAVRAAAQALFDADAVLIVAGAGMSCDSGLPDYRGEKGFYRMGGKDIKMDAVDFHPNRGADFLLSMGFITAMIDEFRQKKPHQGYHMLKSLCDLKKAPNYFVLTSNIDAYFLRAGFNEEYMYESHGNCQLLQCCNGGTWDDACESGIWNWPTDYILPSRDDNIRITQADALQLPRCKKCNSYARPHISHSTDYPEDIVPTRKTKQEKSLLKWLTDQQRSKLVVIEVGCGTSIHSLRVETEIMVGKRPLSGPRTTLIRIDPGNANVPLGQHVGVKMTAMSALTKIETEMKQIKTIADIDVRGLAIDTHMHTQGNTHASSSSSSSSSPRFSTTSF